MPADPVQTYYTSYLLRVWRVCEQGQAASHALLEVIATGEQIGFSSACPTRINCRRLAPTSIAQVEQVAAAGERCPPWDWEREKAAYRDCVLATLARFGLNVRERIVVEEIFTPADLARQTGSWRGALYGASPNNMLAAFRRPPVRDPRVAGLYFAGGTTHPGGGVPMVILSGRLAARTILADLGAV